VRGCHAWQAAQPEGGIPYGPCWVRMTPGAPGSRRTRAVTTGLLNLKVSAPSRADMGQLRSPAAGSDPTRPLSRADGPCQRGRRRRGRASPCVELVPTLAGPAKVVLAGRATTVPFMAVLTGPQRTITVPTLRAEPDRQRVAARSTPLRGHLTGADPADDLRLKAPCAPCQQRAADGQQPAPVETHREAVRP
jgi:hypothetical protein